jgi:hypothetical protein
LPESSGVGIRSSPVDIIPPWFSMLLYHLGNEQLTRLWPQFRDVVSSYQHEYHHQCGMHPHNRKIPARLVHLEMTERSLKLHHTCPSQSCQNRNLEDCGTELLPLVLLTCLTRTVTKHRGRVVNTHASYSGCRGFKSQPWN